MILIIIKIDVNRFIQTIIVRMIFTLTYIAHATLLSLRLAIRSAFSIFAFPSLLAVCPVGHRRALGALGLKTRAPGFLLAGRVLRFAAFHPFQLHVLAVLAAWGILIAGGFNFSNNIYARNSYKMF